MATAKNTRTTTARTDNRTASEIAREKLTEAVALVATRKAEHEQAEIAREELAARLSSGDDTITSLDLAAATFAIERAELLAKAAGKRIKPAETALDSAQAIDNPSLARFVAERIEADPFVFGVYGFPVAVNADDRSNPGVYVNQATATSTDPTTGIMSGRVGITVVSPNGSPIDGAAILAGLAAIEASGNGQVSTNASPSRNGVTVDVRLSNIKPDVPTLATDVDSEALRNFGLDVTDAITKQGGWVDLSNADQYGGGMYGNTRGSFGNRTKRILSGLNGATIANVERDGDQERRTVRVDFDLSSRYFGILDLSGYTKTGVSGLVGEIVAGVGRVEAARVVTEDPTTERPTPGKEFSSPKSGVRVVVEVVAVARIAG
ncbi:hypothetical protein C7C45_04860 [Micromonospora arborensis]|uniref:Uncharacterized protein n=1 Tax=Micromonospora arborensis TaxID=2116518 RepID=A0A318NPJ8_9ACTN|nr:hypothetical protein [Micromonospora arborensis]PYC75202.1 hypothetical protein C7C45_04860 [Micromonospora arborensis]